MESPDRLQWPRPTDVGLREQSEREGQPAVCSQPRAARMTTASNGFRISHEFSMGRKEKPTSRSRGVGLPVLLELNGLDFVDLAGDPHIVEAPFGG